MQFDYIIIGQGICGTWLSYYLQKEGRSVLVIDNALPGTASHIASGIINPVTGRRVVATWMIDELLPFVWEAYSEIGNFLQQECITQKNILALPAAVDMKEAYQKRIAENNGFIKEVSLQKEDELKKHFSFIFGSFEISPVYLVHLRPLLHAYREKLKSSHSLLEESFDEKYLSIQDDIIQYKNISSQKIIYCNGIHSYTSSYWKNLPATFIKGEALVAEIKGLSAENIYKPGPLTIAPWYDGLWWIGSSYENNYMDDKPSPVFYRQKQRELSMYFKTEVKITDHISSVRPASVERRPFAGLHPFQPELGILNGMGTKGCSLAPWFAKQLAVHLTQNILIDPSADIKRFNRLLSRTE